MAEEIRKKRVEKVIQGTAVPAKRSFGKKFAEIFLGDDISSVKEYLFYDRIVPGIKEMILTGIEMMLFGGDRVAETELLSVTTIHQRLRTFPITRCMQVLHPEENVTRETNVRTLLCS